MLFIHVLFKLYYPFGVRRAEHVLSIPVQALHGIIVVSGLSLVPLLRAPITYPFDLC